MNQAAGAVTGAVGQGSPAAVTGSVASIGLPAAEQAWLVLLHEASDATDDDGLSLAQPLSSGERLDAAQSWDEDGTG